MQRSDVSEQLPSRLSILGQAPRSLVAVQIASDLFERGKARSIPVYMSTFYAGIGQIRSELNRYESTCLKLTPLLHR